MIELIIISGYLCLLLLLGLFASRLFKGTSKDYMLASHSIGPFLLLMSLFGTTMTAFALVGSSGEAFKEGIGVYGMLASSSGIIHSLCFFLLGVKLWGFGKKYGYTTQIQYFRDRLNSDKLGLLLFPILVSLVIPYLLIGVMASGVVINAITEGAFDSQFAVYDYGIPPWLGSLVICFIVLVYVFFGGMRGTAWANAFQTLIFMILGVVTFYVISDKLGGVEAASKAVLEKNPSKLKRSVDPKDIEQFEETFGKWKAMAEYNYAVKEKSLSLDESQKEDAYEAFKPRPPHWKLLAETAYSKKNGLLKDLTIAERNDAYMLQDDRTPPKTKPEWWDEELMEHEQLVVYPRKDGADANALEIFESKIGHPDKLIDPDNPELGKHWSRKKAMGVYRATRWSPDEPHGIDQFLFLTYLFVPLSVGMFPHLFQHWLTAKSAGTFKLPVVVHPLFIMIVWVPCVLVGVWATSATNPETGSALFQPHFPANAVLAAMVKQLTTPMLAGFLTAGILAAIMSSLDSQFLCLGTMFTEDIVTHYGGKDRFSDKQVVFMARAFIILIVAVTYGFSLLEPRRVFTLGVWCFSGFSSLFPLVFAALYWRGLTKAGAYACVLAAAGSWAYLFYQSNYAAIPTFSVDFQVGLGFGKPGEPTPETITLKTMPVMTMIICSTVAMLVVSAITPKPKRETIDKFFPRNT